MNIQAEKVAIIEQVIKIQDEKLLQAIHNLIEFGMQYGEAASDADFWNELTDAQKERIEASMRQLDAGEGTAHQDVMAEFRQRYRS